jgi:hypothetical protein
MRILKAFAWLRWRVLVNSLERSGARDTLERFSLAIEQLGPIMAAVLMIPSAIVLAGAGGYGGWALAQGHPRPLPFEALRFLLLAACVVTVIGPVMLPAAERTNAVRLLLLPISRPLLYTAQAVTTLADPWVLLVVPVVLAVPIGLAVGGAWATSIVAAAAGALFIVVLAGIASLATHVIHLIVRDRRRGELITLAFVLLIPLVGMLPGMIAGVDPESRARRRGAARPAPTWLVPLERGALPLVPSEMFVRSTRRAAERRVIDALAPLGGLAVSAALFHTAAFLLFIRVLDSPGSAAARRTASSRRRRTWRIPGVSPATSAVAVNQIRLALRTPRGRSILLSPVIVFLMFGAMMWRSGSSAELGFITLGSGLALGIFGSFVSLLAVLPLAMNQFSVDRAGLTLAFLSPVDDRELLRGKAIGNGVVVGIPTLFTVAGAAALFPGGAAGLWLSVPIGLAAVYVLTAPVAATLSALFPRGVDLNSVGRGSNAHGAAGFLGFLAFLAAGGLTLALALATLRLLGGPRFVPLVMLAWCAACTVIAWLLLMPAAALLARRRENLAMIRGS